MKTLKTIIVFLLVCTLFGCGDFTRNYLVGDELPPGDIQSQRIAMKTIKVFDDLPDNAQSVKEIYAARCHREEFEKEPKEEMLIGDFKIQAYAKGADGISNITVEKNSALMENCWYMLEGKAKMFMLSNK